MKGGTVSEGKVAFRRNDVLFFYEVEDMNPGKAIMSAEKSTASDPVEEARKIKIVVEVDEDRNVKVYSNYTPVEVEVVKYDEIEDNAELVAKAKEIALKAPNEVYTD